MTQCTSWQVSAPNGEFDRVTAEMASPAEGQVLVEIAGCGVCHTDIGFYAGDVNTASGFPLVLGHEISGRIAELGPNSALQPGQAVIVPAVFACGVCSACKRGRATSCAKGWMPGNHGPGGFASHILVPERGLCLVPQEQLDASSGLQLADLAVIADAVTTPYQAIQRAGLERGDLAIVLGVGGVGSFAVQIAAAMGATVIGLDVNPERLAQAGQHGAAVTIDVNGMNPKELRNLVREEAKRLGAPHWGWRVFECSGTAAGQQTAFGLVNRGGSMSVVGFTPQKISLRLSNLMAFDAEAYGNWGCDPALYPEALALVLEGSVQLAPFIEHLPMSKIGEAFDRVHRGRVAGRVVLIPDPQTTP